MGDGEEIIGGLCTIGGKFHLIDLTCRTCGNSGNKVAILIPISALTVGRGNIAVRVDFVGCPCQIILRVDELTLFVIGQDIAQLADRELAERLLVAVFFGNNVLIHVIRGVADHLPDTVALDLKLYRVGRVVIVALRSLQFLDEITAQGQLFGCFHKTVRVRVEHVRFLGSAAAGGVDHGDVCFITLVVQLVQRKCRVGDFDSLAGFEVGFDKLQITFQFLIQNIKGHVVVGGGGDAACGNRKATLRAAGIHRHNKRVTLEHILGNRGLDHKVLPIG